LYKLLAGDATFRTTAPWAQRHFFWGDERHVSPDQEDSNYRMAHESMLSRLPVPSANIHRIKGEMENASQAADDYEERLREFIRLESHGLPRFDLVLLGMGPDGHTASLFPESSALSEALRLTVACHVEKLNADRITLTAPVFNSAASVIFLVSGEEKAAMLRTVLQGASEPQRFPAQLIHPTAGTLAWLVDSAAAAQLV
jgi:6-phosphogluconolactonase